jgi:hypothetical protein
MGPPRNKLIIAAKGSKQLSDDIRVVTAVAFFLANTSAQQIADEVIALVKNQML